MYSIQSIPITNNNQQSFPTKTQIKERLAQKLAFDWLLPKQSCLFFDIIGRQLVKKPVPQMEVANGLSSLRVQLLSIDAHCFSYLICSVLVDDKDVNCRNCGKKDKLLIFMLHSVALEGTNRYFHSIIDYICIDCAKEVCSKELRLTLQRQDKRNTNRWVKTFASLQKITQTKRITTLDLHKLLLLMSNSVGYQVSNMQSFIDMFVQEKFAAEQINLLQPDDKLAETPVTDVISLSYVKSFLTCACCGCSVRNSDVKLGVMSTVYYDSARVFAVPYYVCSRPECIKTWQLEHYSQSRFTKLLSLHQTSMHECFRQSLQYLYYVAPNILGIEHSEFVNQWNETEDIAENNNLSALLMTVEGDMLNKLFNLHKQQNQANEAFEALRELCKDPCVPKLDQCVMRCLCEVCTTKNLLFIELLKQFELVRSTENNENARVALDQVFDAFCKLCVGKKTEPKKQTKSHNRCWKNSTLPVSSFEQDINDQFRDWRLKPKKRKKTSETNRCGHYYSQDILNNDQMEEFFDDTCSFLSQMF